MAAPDLSGVLNHQARLSWVFASMAGLVGAAAFLHTEGYFVTFMTGNTERAILGWFRDEGGLAAAAGMLLLSFIAGVIVASWVKHRFCSDHPHDVVLLTTFCLTVAAVLDLMSRTRHDQDVRLGPILLVAFGIGALNTSFVKDGEVSVPLSYQTGTVVKMSQGIARHMTGGTAVDWLGHALLYLSFCVGGLLGGLIGVVVDGAVMMFVAAAWSAVTTAYAHFHQDIYGPLPDA